MGLDTSHDCWHGSYSSFRRFREAVAEAAKEHYEYEPEYEAHPFRAFMGWWDWEHPYEKEPDHHPYSDPLDVFFVHSDCEGWIFPDDSGTLAGRLEPLIGYLDDSGPWSHRDSLRRFVDGLRKASEMGDVVDFH